ncbi:MAG: hypothetical protein Ct9H300mP18_13070 [Candidatus Neomarinimicrobiota bacterium]|nr:MAG: hypothetical protein Ct9H300mP18_13070 [Candidatus Neomarinimicrobiota bacterium]
MTGFGSEIWEKDIEAKEWKKLEVKFGLKNINQDTFLGIWT